MGKKSKRKQAKGEGAGERNTGAPVKFKVGDRVTFKGLNAAEYNGKFGKVVSLPKLNDPDGRYGVLPDGKKAPLAFRPRNIALVKGQTSRKTTEQQRKEREETVAEYATRRQDDSMNADQLAMMRMMMNMFLTEEKQIEVFGRKIEPMPDFCQELKYEGGGFPTGVDEKWGDEYLRTAFEQSSNLPHYFEMYIKRPEYEPSPRDLLKRLGTNHRAKLEWYFGPHSLGDIFPRTMEPYSPLIRHSYSNQAYRKEALHLGTTHVAVGFVDLGILFAATLHDPPTTTRSGPLRFLGIEMSAYAVAKTLVMWEMLKQTPFPEEQRNRHLRNIMQVWFSSTWGEGTEDAAKAALSALCGPSKQKPYHPDVRELLEHWNGASSMPLKQARSQRAQSTTNARTCISDLLRKRDRIAMANHELTGDFGLQGEPCAGNILMFDCPDGTPPLDTGETPFSALDWKDIVECMVECTSISPRTTVVEAAEIYVFSNISKLADSAQKGLVTVELVCAKFQDVIEDIAAAKPWTMSWSNVPDYVNLADFHRMARACSVHGDTIHFGYSMNWVMDVFGVNIIDYHGKECTELRAEIIKAANKSVESVYKLLGWDKYLRLPPPVNPINTTAHFGLEIKHYHKWARCFFAIALRGGPCKVGNVEHAIGSPLSPTGASTVAFTWTYDPEIKFNALGSTFLPS